MTTPFIEGRCYFTPESIVEITSTDFGDGEVQVGFNIMAGVKGFENSITYAWVPRYVVAALIFGEE